MWFFFLEQVFTEPELNKQAAKSRSYKAFWIHYTQKRQKRFTVPRHPISSSHFPGLLAYYRCEETAKYRAFEHDWRTAWFRTTIKEIQAKEDPCLFLTIRTDRQPHVKIRITHLDDDRRSLNYNSMEKNLSEPPKLCQILCWPLDPVVVVTFRTNCIETTRMIYSCVSSIVCLHFAPSGLGLNFLLSASKRRVGFQRKCTSRYEIIRGKKSRVVTRSKASDQYLNKITWQNM